MMRPSPLQPPGFSESGTPHVPHTFRGGAGSAGALLLACWGEDGVAALVVNIRVVPPPCAPYSCVVSEEKTESTHMRATCTHMPTRLPP